MLAVLLVTQGGYLIFLSSFVVFVVHDEAMAYAGFDRKILVAKSGFVSLIENIDVIEMPVKPESDFLVTAPFKQFRIESKDEWRVLPRVEHSKAAIESKVRRRFFVGKFETVWKSAIGPYDPVHIDPSAHFIGGCLAEILNHNCDVIGIWLAEFRMIGPDIGSQFETRRLNSIISQIASSDPQKNSRESENDGENGE